MRVARSNWRGDAVAVFFYVIYNVETDRQAVAVDEYSEPNSNTRVASTLGPDHRHHTAVRVHFVHVKNVGVL